MACVLGREQRANHNRGQHHLGGLPIAKFLNNLKIITVFFGKHSTPLYFDTFGGCLAKHTCVVHTMLAKGQISNGFPISGINILSLRSNGVFFFCKIFQEKSYGHNFLFHSYLSIEH